MKFRVISHGIQKKVAFFWWRRLVITKIVHIGINVGHSIEYLYFNSIKEAEEECAALNAGRLTPIKRLRYKDGELVEIIRK